MSASDRTHRKTALEERATAYHAFRQSYRSAFVARALQYGIFLLIAVGCSSPPEIPACEREPGGAVSLPEDDRIHPEAPVEWWYWVGHLTDDSEQQYGFEQVFFRVDVNGVDAWMAHVAVTDIANGAFEYDALAGLDAASPESDFGLSLGGWQASLKPSSHQIRGTADDYALDLSLLPTKPPVLQHTDGYTDYDVGGYTYYYSRERLAVSGTLSRYGEPLSVHGSGWFDHQWGDLMPVIEQGWDWFSLQLDDQREVMIFNLHREEGTELVGGSIVEADCTVRNISPDELTVIARETWVSPHTGCAYPSGWDIQVAGLDLTVTPALPYQELDTGLKIYWEGAAFVHGSATGRAYVELNGYCP